jgi:hypothetical protein
MSPLGTGRSLVIVMLIVVAECGIILIITPEALRASATCPAVLGAGCGLAFENFIVVITVTNVSAASATAAANISAGAATAAHAGA